MQVYSKLWKHCSSTKSYAKEEYIDYGTGLAIPNYSKSLSLNVMHVGLVLEQY